MPDYDKIVNEMSPDDAASLFAENGMSDQPMAQQIVRKLKGAQTRQRIAAATADGKPMFATPQDQDGLAVGAAKEIGKAPLHIGENLGVGASALGETVGHNVQELDSDRNSVYLPRNEREAAAMGTTMQDALAKRQARDVEIDRSKYARTQQQDPLANTHSYQENRPVGPSASPVAQTAEMLGGFIASPAAGVIGNAGNRVKDVVEHGGSSNQALGTGAAQAGLDTATAGVAGKLLGTGGTLARKALGYVAGNEAYIGGNAAITSTYDTDAAKQELMNPASHAMALLPMAGEALHAGGARIGEQRDAQAANRAADAQTHLANLQAQDKAKEVQQGIQNAQLVPTQQMRTGPDGQLAPSKAIVPGGPGASVDLAPKTENLTDQTRITSGEASGKSKPPANGQPADMPVEPHEMPPISNINAIYGTRSGKSKPPANGRTVDMSVEGNPTPFDLPPAAHQIVVDAKLSPQETIQLAKGMEGWDAHFDPEGAARNVAAAIKAMRERAASKADKQQATQGAPDVIPQELRQEPQQGVQPVGVEARSNQANGMPDTGRSAGIEETQGRRGNETSEQSSQKQGLGPVREGKSQKGLDDALGKAQPRYNFGEKSFIPEFESSADKAAYIIASRTPGSSKSVAHDKIVRAAEAAGHDIEQLHARGLEIRNEIKSQARDAESGAPIRIAPKQQSNTRGGFINLGDIVDHTMKIARFIGSHIANDSVLVDLERRASGMARAVQHSAEGIQHDFARLAPNMKDAVNRYMDGDRSVVLPPEWTAKLDKFRMKQDQLSAWSAEQLNKAADHLDKRAGTSLLPEKAKELQQLSQQMRDHAATFTSNIGNYVNRQYAIHTQGAEWINKVRNTPAYNDAITESMQRNPNLSQDQARVQIEDLMSEQIADALAPIKGNGSVTGALNERNDVSPTIRKLFGEVTDPGERAAISLMKTSQLLENMKVQNGIADAAQHFGLLNEMPEHGAENYVHLSSVGSLKNSPIGGMYAPKDVARQLVGINAQTNATLRLLAKMSAGTNVAATVGNMAASVPRQIIANGPLAFSSGYLTPGNIGAALKMATRALTDEVYKEHLMSLNVIDQGMTRSQLGAQIAHMKGVQNGLVQMDNGLKRGLRMAHQAFSIPDDLLRGLSFASELRRAEKRGMVGAEAEHWASNRMGDSTPDWAKAWKLPKTISTYAPGVGQFATMAAEMTRIQLKQIQHTAEAWQSGQHAEAIMRTVGLATTMAASYGMAQYFMNKHAGVSPEEDTAVRNSQATPDYMKSHVLQYGDKDASGKRTIRDLSSMNPYYPIAEPIKFIADGKPLAALAQAISPYLGVSIFGQRVGEAISGSKLNMQGDSEALSKPDAGPIEQVKDRALHVAAGFEPATERKFRTGQPYSVFPNTDFTPDRAARQDVKQVSQTYDAYVKDVYKEAAKRGDGALTDQEAKQISDLQNKRDSDLTTTGKQITDYGGSSNSTLGAERANKIRAVDIVHPGDNSPELIKARYRLGSVEKALSTFETFKQLSDNDPAKAKFFAENQDVIRASASAYGRYTDAKRLLNIAEVHPENPELIHKAMSLLK